MFVRLSVASATLASGLILGNWFLSYPSHMPLAPADVAKFAAPNLDDTSAQSASVSAVVAVASPQTATATITVSENRVWPDAAVSRAPVATQPDKNSQWALTLDLQTELLRLGCYSGPLDGRWSTLLRYALQDFTVRVNSTLPVDGPDVALLSLAKGQTTPVCGAQASVTVSEQPAFGSAPPGGGLLPDGPAVSLDGRMSLGATPGSTSKSSYSSRRARDDKIFTNPLGQF